MAKLNLSKTPEQVQAEEAQKQREIEEAIQQSQMERQRKIIALHKKQKTSKFIVISLLTVFGVSLLTFGTYNTFFKHPLTQEEVRAIANSVGNKFPCEGIPNYVRDNADSLFQQYVQYNRNTYVSANIDPDTVEVSKIKKYSNTMVEVFFSADVVMVEKDIRITDEELINQLMKSGLNAQQEPDAPVEQGQTNTAPANCIKMANGAPIVTVDGRFLFYQLNEDGTNKTDSVGHFLVYAQNTDGSPATDAEGHMYYYAVNEDGTLKLDSANHAQVAEFDENWMPKLDGEGGMIVMAEQPTLDPVNTPAPTPTPEPNAPVTEAQQQGNDGTTVEYYMTANGNIYQRGQVIRVRYAFTLPVEYVKYYDIDGKLTQEIPEGHYASEYTTAVSAYEACGQMAMYSLQEMDMTDFSRIRQDFNSTIPSDNLKFDKNKLLGDQEGALDIRAKVSNILTQLYTGTATTNVFANYRQFETWGATFNGIDEFYYYTEANALGFNAYCVYSITTPQGFSYEIYMYMKLEDMGSGNYKITSIL